MKRTILRIVFWLVVLALMVFYVVRSLQDSVPGAGGRTTYEELKRSADVRKYEGKDFDKSEPADDGELQALHARSGDAGVYVETEEVRKRGCSGVVVSVGKEHRGFVCEVDGARIPLGLYSSDPVLFRSVHAVRAGDRIIVFEAQCGGSEVHAATFQGDEVWYYHDSHHSHCVGVVSDDIGLVALYIFEARRRKGWSDDGWESQVKYLDLKTGRVVGSNSLPVSGLKGMGFVPGKPTLILEFDGFGRKLDLTPILKSLDSGKRKASN